MKKIAPSILSADFTRLGEEIRKVEEAGADYIHVDVMDGHFVPNITVGPMIVEAVRRSTSLPLDVHLMIEEPERFIVQFRNAGADIISVQFETCRHLNGTIRMIKDSGARAGVVLNPATSPCVLDYILKDVDMVLIMTVNPGFAGQRFIPEMLEKVREIRKMIDNKGLPVEIELDGGIKLGNIAECAMAGGDIFVSGSGIFGTADYMETIRGMRRAIERGAIK
ncbi:MAG: ribulose-phosphate 3-epimerase [Candidatus Bathyarchaeia archaeon]